MQTFNWHLELSSKCSLKCPRCSRTERPEKFIVTELNIDFIKSVFSYEILKNTKRVILCGGQGDPIYCKDFLKIVKYLKTNPNINLQIVTNGSYKTKDWWHELSNILNENDDVVFSVDGWDQQSNDLYRVNNDFASILNGINILAENKDVNIIWSTIVFRFNENELDKIKQLAKQNGATHFQVVKSMMFGTHWPVYLNQEGIDPMEPVNVDSNVSKVLTSDRSNLVNLIDKDRKTNSIKHAVKQNYKKIENKVADIIPSCMIGERSLYIDAEGILYPCSWISHPFGTRQHKDKKITWNDSLFVKHKQDFNLHKHCLESILNNKRYKKLQETFFDKDNHFIECLNKCPKKEVLKRIESIN